MNIENIDLAKLRKNYGSTKTGDIKELLNRIDLVVLSNKGVGTIQGYYTFDDELMNKIKAKPRNVSHTFSTVNPNKLIEGLEVRKELIFYIKSSSRFFLKPDIGEVFDQMTDEDKELTKAIYTKGYDYLEVEGTSGEDFVMTALLLG